MAQTGKILFLATVTAFLAFPASAQDILPQNFAGWESKSVEVVAPGGLGKFAGSSAAALREYGTQGAERRTYQKGGESIQASVYRVHDATGAYGVLTFLRGEGMRPADLGQHSAISSERSVALVGNLVLSVEQPSGNLLRFNSDLKGLVGALYSKAQQGLLPTVGNYLPAKGQVAGSRRYASGPVALSSLLPLASGDWVGFADGAELELARYEVGGSPATIAVVIYPTPQVAERRMGEMRQRLGLNPAEAPAEGGAVYARRSASLVALVIGASSRAGAEGLLEPIRYDADITWNEPGFSATDPTIGDIVVGSIYGTGAILLFALAAGLGFGGLRVVTKFLLPGRLFDRPESVEIIQLGITSKPIEAKDFYIWTR